MYFPCLTLTKKCFQLPSDKLKKCQSNDNNIDFLQTKYDHLQGVRKNI
uniref:Uncharacterized protein n=1 Tax=Tetranychus urticae TaxID=32264 RepID=T1JTU0_TETUR